MNIFTSKLPDSIRVNGKSYQINTDFKVWIEIENTFLDKQMPIPDKIAKMLRLCFRTLPPTLEDAIEGMMSFYCCGADEVKRASGKKSTAPIYSFMHDGELIYSAFYSQYKIDLLTANLHWWQFMALFKGLGDDNKICKIMEYRAINIEDIKNDAQKKFYRRMKRIYTLDTLRDESERESDMISVLEKVF